MFLNVPTVRRAGALLVAGLVLFLAAMVAKDWYFPRIEYFAVQPPPVVLTETRFSERIREVPVVRTVLVKDPSPSQREKIQARWPDLNLEKVDLLGELEVPPAPDGGKILSTLDKESGAPSLTFVPAARSFFGFGGKWEVSGGVSWGQYGNSFPLRVSKELLRTGSVQWRAEVETRFSAGEAQTSATILGTWRF